MKKAVKKTAKTTIDQTSTIENLTFYDRQNLIWDLKCTAPEKLVLFALNMHADSNGECYPGLKRIQDKCGLTRADRIIDRLISQGLLTKYSREDKEGRTTSNGYQILFKALKSALDTVSGDDDTVSRAPRQSVGGDDDTVSRAPRQSVGGDDDTVSYELDHSESLKLTRSKLTRSEEQDPECAIEIKTCQVEIVLEEERTEAFSPLALDQTGNTFTVNGLKKGGDKFSAPGLAALASSAVADMAVKVDVTTIVCDDMGSNGFNGFRDKYQLLATSVRRKFGRMDDAKAAWKAAWKGFEPPERFWEGLDCYYEQQQDEYLRKGECWMVGAKRFLDPEERHWEAAITSHQVNRQAQAFGVDMNNPAEVKRASLLSSNLRNWEIAKQQMILKGVAI